MKRILHNLYYSKRKDEYYYKIDGKYQQTNFTAARLYCERWGYCGWDIEERKWMDK